MRVSIVTQLLHSFLHYILCRSEGEYYKIKLQPSISGATTNPIGHCKTDSHRLNSQRQMHEVIYSIITAGIVELAHLRYRVSLQSDSSESAGAADITSKMVVPLSSLVAFGCLYNGRFYR